MTEPVYERAGDLFHPLGNARGPWFPDVQHGGAVAGLIGRAIDLTPSVAPMQLAQLSIDLTRKVPMAPVSTEVEVLRDGKRVQGLAVRVLADGVEVSRATAVRIRVADGAAEGPYVGVPHDIDVVPPSPEAGEEIRLDVGPFDYFRSFEVRDTGPTETGHTRWWYRFIGEFVGGEPVSPTVRLCATADLIMSAGSIMDTQRYLTVNPDLMILPHRLPDGEWICMDSRARAEANGVGQSDGVLFDRRGRLGRSIKSQLIDRR